MSCFVICVDLDCTSCIACSYNRIVGRYLVMVCSWFHAGKNCLKAFIYSVYK